jgi:hypothetical protein
MMEKMGESTPERPITQNLNVAADEGSIYQGGHLSAVNIEDLLENEVAIRQLINDLNLTKRDNERSRAEIEALKLERTGYAMQPWLLGFTAIMNLFGVVLVGIGTNLLTSTNSPAFSGWILGIGVTISILSGLGPTFLPFLIKHVSEKQNAIQK